MTCPQRIDAQLGPAEIRRHSDECDVGDQETHLRRVDRGSCGLGIDRKVRARDRAAASLHSRTYAGRHTAAGLARLFVAHEQRRHIAGGPKPGTPDRADRFDDGADPCLLVCHAAAPDLAVDHMSAEWIRALGALPVLRPVLRGHRVQVAGKQQGPAFRTPHRAPHVGPAGLERSRTGVVESAGGVHGFEHPLGEGPFVGRHAGNGGGFAHQPNDLVAVDGRRGAFWRGRGGGCG